MMIAAPPPSLHSARRRLGLGLWWYVLVLSVLAALASAPPTRGFRWPRVPEISWLALASGGALASAAVRAFAVGFVLTFGGHRPGRTGRHLWRVARAGALTILAIEVVRWLWRVPVRPAMVAVGALAAVVGALCYEHAFARRRADHALGSAAARVLPLELPLTGAALLLVPGLWLVARDVERLGVAALLACFGASVLTSARISRGPAAGGSWTHAAVAAVWVAVAITPAWLAHPTRAALLTLGVAAFAAAHAFLPPPDATDRRFEGPAIRRALPLLVAYVFANAMWPFDLALRPTTPDVDPLWGSGQARGALEHATIFTLVGYALAALRGRREESRARTWKAIGWWVAAGAVAVEAIRAVHPELVGGVTRAGVAVFAAALGAAVYARHRDHIRAWRAEGGGSRVAGDARGGQVEGSARRVPRAHVEGGEVGVDVTPPGR